MHVRQIVVGFATGWRSPRYGGKLSESVRRSWTFAVQPLHHPTFAEGI